MSEKSKLLYELMLRKGYLEDFTRLICAEMNTDFTAERMMSYISRGNHRLEDVADEMLAMRLAVMHNLYFYNKLMERIREALDNGYFAAFRNEYSEKLGRRI